MNQSTKEYVLNLFNALSNNNIMNLNYCFMSQDYLERIQDYICDKVLDVLTYFRKSIEQTPPTPSERLKINSIHQINHPNPPTLIANETNVQELHRILLESDNNLLYHLEYKYDDNIFRIILKKDQLYKIHDIVEEENHPSSEIETVNFHPTQSEAHIDVIYKYAGPVGDFYQFLDLELKHHEPDFGKYLLTENCESYLLEHNNPKYFIQVEDILGQEYIFRHSTLV